MTHPAAPIVYLGPTLRVHEAEELLSADYRPPVRRGDLPRHHDGPVLIIDGEFHQSLSVSPKEILGLLDDGTYVAGAASMGALRSAELHSLGMAGYGWIFDGYRSGRILGDDEVAVAYRPDDFRPLTVPLVNVRRWLEQLVTAALLDADTAQRLLRPAGQIFYADRSEESLLRVWATTVGSQKVRRLLQATGGVITDAKAADARLALLAIKDLAEMNGRLDLQKGGIDRG